MFYKNNYKFYIRYFMARLKRSKYISRDTVYINVYKKYTVSLIELIGSLSDS